MVLNGLSPIQAGCMGERMLKKERKKKPKKKREKKQKRKGKKKPTEESGLRIT